MEEAGPGGNRFERGEFRLEDPRQRALHRLLRSLVGEGPASFYRDACEHMAADPPMRAVTHQVGHLVREIDAALIGMLGPVTSGGGEQEDPLEDEGRRRAVEALLEAFGVPGSARADKAYRIAQQLTRPSRPQQIRSVLAALGIAEDETMRKGWISPSRGAHSWAHRDQLLPPRPPDQEFYRFWEQTQAVWLAVLERFETRFTDSFPLIDELLAVEEPTRAHVAEFQEKLPNTIVTYDRFFGGMTDARWIELLQAKHFFDRPPAPEANENGAVFVAPWPQSRLLARIADTDPEKVRDIILSVPRTENVSVHADFAEAALKMPAELAIEVARRAADGIGSPYYAVSLVRSLASLVAYLAQAGAVEEATGLARQLVALVPPMDRDDDTPLVTRDPVPRFRPPEIYEEVLGTAVDPLMDAAGVTAFEMLCDVLEGALRDSAMAGEDEDDRALPREDALYILRPAIEESSLNRYQGSLGEAAIYHLLVAVRDAAGRISDADPTSLPSLLAILESRDNETFQRLALHLLRTRSEETGARALIGERLKGKTASLTPGMFHEYAVLLRENFGRLSPEDHAQILGVIGDGPPEEELRTMREYGASEDFHKGPLSGDELDAFVRGHAGRWKLRFYGILADQLPEAERAEYERLAGEHPDLMERDPLFYGEPRVRAIPRRPSPRSAEDLQHLAVEDVVAFLRGFEPGDGWEEPGVRDVAHELHLAVAKAAPRFAAQAERFRGLESSYVRALLWGLRDGLRDDGRESEDTPPGSAGPTVPWESVLSLCRWVLDQPRQASEEQYRGGVDIGWGLSRQQIGDLLRKALSTDTELPFEMREQVWDVLRRLSEDPEPTLTYEEDRRDQPGSTPRDLAINTVRGVALHAVVDYVLWVRRNLGDASWQGLESVPDAREVLEARSSAATERTRTVRSVYGARLLHLLYLDRPWLEARLPYIFPQATGEAQLRDAAWESYLLDWVPSGEAFEVLRTEYQHAVAALDPGRSPEAPPRDPDGFLARHLMILLWRGILAFDEPSGVLDTFYTRASDGLRARAAGFVGRQLLHIEGEVDAAVLDRFGDLWERRLQSAAEEREGPASEELGAFAWFFISGKFDENTSLERLDRALSLGADVGRDAHQLAKNLAAVAPAHPRLAVTCLDKIVQGILSRPDSAFPIIAIETNTLTVLQIARDSGDDEPERIATALANRLVARGYQQFQRAC